MTTAVKRITPCPPGFSDHVYKVAHGVEIPLRIWPAPSGKRDAPWLLWFHGGEFGPSVPCNTLYEYTGSLADGVGGFISGKHVIPVC